MTSAHYLNETFSSFMSELQIRKETRKERMKNKSMSVAIETEVRVENAVSHSFVCFESINTDSNFLN